MSLLNLWYNTSTKALKEQALQSSFSYIREKSKKEYAKLCSLHNLEPHTASPEEIPVSLIYLKSNDSSMKP